MAHVLTAITFNYEKPNQFTVWYPERDDMWIEYPEDSTLDEKERTIIEEHFKRVQLPAVVGIE